jgi:hypothetical protein
VRQLALGTDSEPREASSDYNIVVDMVRDAAWVRGDGRSDIPDMTEPDQSGKTKRQRQE